ncbi:MAG: ERCC4 domain-containing protein [Pirellulaceae bacterium]
MAFQIITDTREQEPYAFACQSVRAKLDAGDYSVAGFEGRVAVERKSLPDFVRTVFHESDRFAVELEKLAGMEAASIVVEADLDAVLRGRHRDALRAVDPHALLGAATHITVRWGVPVCWCGSRQAACAFTESYLRMFVRHVLNQEGADDA